MWPFQAFLHRIHNHTRFTVEQKVIITQQKSFKKQITWWRFCNPEKWGVGILPETAKCSRAKPNSFIFIYFASRGTRNTQRPGDTNADLQRSTGKTQKTHTSPVFACGTPWLHSPRELIIFLLIKGETLSVELGTSEINWTVISSHRGTSSHNRNLLKQPTLIKYKHPWFEIDQMIVDDCKWKISCFLNIFIQQIIRQSVTVIQPLQESAMQIQPISVNSAKRYPITTLAQIWPIIEDRERRFPEVLHQNEAKGDMNSHQSHQTRFHHKTHLKLRHKDPDVSTTG